MSPAQTHDFRSVLQGVFVLYAVVSFAVALFAVLCWCISDLVSIVLWRAECFTTAPGSSPPCCEYVLLLCSIFGHKARPAYMYVAHNPPWEQAEVDKGWNRHRWYIKSFCWPELTFFPTLSFAFSRANSLGQRSFTADCSCIWKLCAKSHLGEVKELKITWSCP